MVHGTPFQGRSDEMSLVGSRQRLTVVLLVDLRQAALVVCPKDVKAAPQEPVLAGYVKAPAEMHDVNPLRPRGCE
jgi:hypothetical protein